MSLPAHILKARKRRADVRRFAALIKTPAVGSFIMPVSGRIAFVSVEAAEAGTTAGTIIGGGVHRVLEGEPGFEELVAYPNLRIIKVPALLAGGRVVIDRVEPARTVEPAEGFEVFLDIGLGRWRKIAEAEPDEG